MHILFVLDPLPGLKAWKDSSVAIMRSLAKQGHTFSYTTMSGLFIDHGLVMAKSKAMQLVPGADVYGHSWWQETEPAQDTPLKDFDGVVMRKDPPFDMEYVYATHMFDYAQAQGAKVFNTGAAIRNHPEKLAITEFPQYTVPTIVSRDIQRLKAFHDQHKDIIIKPLDGMGGSGIFRLNANDPNTGSALEMLTAMGSTSIMAQTYIPAIKDGDKRILIIDGKPVPYALARMPVQGETRGNLAAGGTGIAQKLNAHDLAMAEHVGAKLAPRGLFLIGLDVIGQYITEINVTSPTCFVEITEQTSFSVADAFVAALEQRIVQT